MLWLELSLSELLSLLNGASWSDEPREVLIEEEEEEEEGHTGQNLKLKDNMEAMFCFVLSSAKKVRRRRRIGAPWRDEW